MSHHKISADGMRIECHAPADADCRTYPTCDTETWSEETCDDHTPAHEASGGNPCWMLPWVDALRLDETYDETDLPVTIIPGEPVDLEFEGDYVLWHYTKEATK